MAPTEEDVRDWELQEGDTTDMAQAYRDLARGDQAAAAIEADLDRFHSKLDALLDVLEDKHPATQVHAEEKPSPAASSTTAVVSSAAESAAASQDHNHGAHEKEPGSHQGQKET